jgi:hypothetical protein
VDHIVIGAPPRKVPASALGRVVSMQVAAGARCSVTLVREAGAEPDAPRPPLSSLL